MEENLIFRNAKNLSSRSAKISILVDVHYVAQKSNVKFVIVIKYAKNITRNSMLAMRCEICTYS